MNPKKPCVQTTLTDSVPYALRYTETLNSVFSALAFSLGIGCISTENPKLYAWLSLFFIIMLWRNALRPYKKRLRMLVTANHPVMSTLKVLQRTIPFFTGWIFLGLVALGSFNKNGFEHSEKGTAVNESYVGQFLYKYENGNFYRVSVKDDQSMIWTCISGFEKGTSGTEQTDHIKIADKIYIASWIEKTGTNVTQVLNLNTMKVYSTIIDGKERYVISGDIVREK